METENAGKQKELEDELIALKQDIQAMNTEREDLKKSASQLMDSLDDEKVTRFDQNMLQNL